MHAIAQKALNSSADYTFTREAFRAALLATLSGEQGQKRNEPRLARLLKRR